MTAPHDDEHDDSIPHQHFLRPGRCCTPDLCDGTHACRAPVHIHGCYGDVDLLANCTAPGEHAPPDSIAYCGTR